MKTIFSSRKHLYLARVSIFLITVVLIVGMAGCGGGGNGGNGESYTLTIDSTAGGIVAVNNVIIPGKTIFTYGAGTVVSLNAIPDVGYQFANWTGNVSTIADVNAPTTNITMSGNYFITANFYKPEIQDWYDLDAIRDNLGGNYTLMNDLNSTTAGYTELASLTANGGKGWEPIGSWNWEQEVGEFFEGTFNGQGYQIRGLYINRTDESGVGLFSIVGMGGVIKNIGVVNATVTGDDLVGGLVGGNAGTVSNSYSTGSVTGEAFVGGLVGVNPGTVSNSYSTGSVTGGLWVGGLVGGNSGTVSNSYSTGSITCEDSVGGLVGDASGTVRNSYYNYDEVLINGENIITIGASLGDDFEEWLANGKFLDINERLSKEDSYYVINNVNDFKQLLAFGQNPLLKFKLKSDLELGTEPGFYIPYLAGEFDGNGHKISNLSFNADFVCSVGLFGYIAPGGKVSNMGAEDVSIIGVDRVGGLVGYNDDGTVSNSYSTGSVTGRGWVGGLMGCNGGTVSNSYSTGTVTGEFMVGGLVGANAGTVSNSYSTGNVTGDDSVGGLVGASGIGCNVTNSFWDTQTSGQNSSDGGTGKNTTQMQDIMTFSGATWNITTVGGIGERNTTYIWNIVDSVTYPFLSWQPV